jgi:hypothetical protein
MIEIHRGLYVSINQQEKGPSPLPLESGFNPTTLYLALGGFTMSESAEMFFLLSNDRDEVWFISNRHVRTARMVTNATEFRIARTAT